MGARHASQQARRLEGIRAGRAPHHPRHAAALSRRTSHHRSPRHARSVAVVQDRCERQSRLQRAGKEEGKREGKKLGLLAGKIAALLAVLEARGIRVSKKIEKRIRAEENVATVDAWIRRAGVCASIDDLLGE